ncbi:MAG TPA: 50S ribosomal protein L16 [bacterium]|nr:50S ribosomal protein L16 [Candidatus Omnitrophota bacterium]HOJ60517.1 50S ribosomal protein L16 [bacterium]HOL96231.1 50S ribosomal protein L16 [bacterium]HPP02500.1 50S ribosomal protein L16 [bacterium]HXK95030.1 50S ribosomal protein L16 [bacterium]
MLMPAREKFRKVHRGNRRGVACRGNKVSFGDYGLKAVTGGWITARQIEAVRVTVNRYVKRRGKVWIRVFPHKPVTAKPAETRMGGGKGAPEMHIAVVKPGHVLFELGGVPESVAREAFRLAGYKLPIQVRFTSRDETL